MTDGRGSIHVKGAGSDSEHVVIALKPLSNAEEIKIQRSSGWGLPKNMVFHPEPSQNHALFMVLCV